MEERASSKVAYRAVLLAGALLVFGLVFRQLLTLLLAVLMTVIIAIPLAAAANRLERRGVPRRLGALLALLAGIAAIALVIALLIPPFSHQTNQFVNDVPGIVNNLREQTRHITGTEPTVFGNRVQHFAQRYTEDPTRLIGPITAIGLNLAGIIGALLLILITAYYMAASPEPLLRGVESLFGPSRHDEVRHVMDRLRRAWVGWMAGVAVHMVVNFVLLYAGLTLAGLDFAVFFAVLSALLVVIPYFGTIAGGLPPVLFALTDSPGKALLVLGIYALVQQVEGNVVIPLVMSQTVRLHPAVIAVGVIVVGQLFGVLGLFVAVPILSLIQVLVDELWVKRLERADGLRAPPDMPMPDDLEVPSPRA